MSKCSGEITGVFNSFKLECSLLKVNETKITTKNVFIGEKFVIESNHESNNEENWALFECWSF